MDTGIKLISWNVNGLRACLCGSCKVRIQYYKIGIFGTELF